MTTVAIVVRAQDGVFQPMLLAPLGARYATTLYRLTGCVLRKITPDGMAPCISSLSDLPADIFVFVNVPIETANHMFLEALVEQTMRQDCGVASGILIDDKRLILHSGWETNPDGTFVTFRQALFLRRIPTPIILAPSRTTTNRIHEQITPVLTSAQILFLDQPRQ